MCDVVGFGVVVVLHCKPLFVALQLGRDLAKEIDCPCAANCGVLEATLVTGLGGRN